MSLHHFRCHTSRFHVRQCLMACIGTILLFVSTQKLILMVTRSASEIRDSKIVIQGKNENLIKGEKKFHDQLNIFHLEMNRNIEKSDRVASDQACQFPVLNPFDPTILKFIKHPDPLICKQIQENLTFVVKNKVFINESLATGLEVKNLRYRTINRPFSATDMALTFGDWIAISNEDMGTGVYINTSALEIAADYEGKKKYSNLHGSVEKSTKRHKNKQSVLEKESTQDVLKNRLNVLIIGIDSVSRSNFVRNLPLTYQFLTKDLGGWEFRGYSKIDDNTFPNILALLTGHKVSTHYHELHEDPANDYLDDWPFLWKNYSEHGYTTLLAEEQPGIFSYKAKGFKRSPTDIYLRPFGLHLNNMPLYDKSSKHCAGNQPEASVILDHVKRFLHTHQESPHFAFNFLWKLSHDSASKIEILDSVISDWFRGVADEKLLSNTALFVMSDHGNRFDHIRSTLIGRYEERMPFLFLHLPKWFIEDSKHKRQVSNLNTNTWRLSCQYDVHETLVDILNQNYGSERETLFKRGVSLFNEIPKLRLCKDIQVPAHFCVCQVENSIPVDSEKVRTAAKSVITAINDALKPIEQRCHRVKLQNINSAQEFTANERVKYNQRYDFNKYLISKNVTDIVSHLRVTLRTQPNGGVFEALVQVNQPDVKNEKDLMMTVGPEDISRINAYGDSANCISNTHRQLEKFCTCS